METDIPKNPYPSGTGNFLYFQKQNFLIFRETYMQNPRIFRTLIYSERWHIQNHDILKSRGIFTTLLDIYGETFCKKSSKNKKKFLYFLLFREMKLYCFNIKKFLIFQKKETPRRYFTFQETELSYISGTAL